MLVSDCPLSANDELYGEDKISLAPVLERKCILGNAVDGYCDCVKLALVGDVAKYPEFSEFGVGTV